MLAHEIPWDNRTGYSKAIAIFATVLMISVGLCGANFALFSRYGYISGPNDPTRSAGFSMFLLATGFLETVGIAVGVGGLVIGTISLASISLYKRFSGTRKED